MPLKNPLGKLCRCCRKRVKHDQFYPIHPIAGKEVCAECMIHKNIDQPIDGNSKASLWIAHHTGYPIREVRTILKAYMLWLYERLLMGRHVILTGVGKFLPKIWPGRVSKLRPLGKGKNEYYIPDRKRIIFRLESGLLNKIRDANPKATSYEIEPPKRMKIQDYE